MTAKASTHICDQMENIVKLSESVKHINHALYDNGQKGLITTVTELRVSTEELKNQTSDLKTAIHGINDFMVGIEAERKTLDKANTNLKWFIGISFTIITILYGTGILGKNKTYIMETINQYSRGANGMPYDSVYWNDESNPPYIHEIQ